MVTDEFTIEDYVVCKERITDMNDPIEALAMYLVQDSEIQRLWLKIDQ